MTGMKSRTIPGSVVSHIDLDGWDIALVINGDINSTFLTRGEWTIAVNTKEFTVMTKNSEVWQSFTRLEDAIALCVDPEAAS